MEQKKYLIIIDNFGKIQEVPLESFGKDRLILGSDPVQCDIVIRSNIISHVHGNLQGRNKTKTEKQKPVDNTYKKVD